MALTLAQIRNRARYKLADLKFPEVQWTDDDIDAAIADAVHQFSNKRANRQTPASIALSVDSDTYRATLDVSTETGTSGFLDILAVEYPTGYDPPCYQGWHWLRDRDEIELEMYASSSDDGESAAVEWGLVHTCTESSGTIPNEYLELMAKLARVKVLETHAVRNPAALPLVERFTREAEKELNALPPEGPEVKAVFRSQGW